MSLGTTGFAVQVDTIGGWIFLALMLPGAVVIFAVVIAFIVRRRRHTDEPVGPTSGYWRVLGIDSQTGQKRESMFHADSRLAAQGRAEMEGIVITDIHPVDEPANER